MKHIISLFLTLFLTTSAYSQVTISQEDYAKLPQEVKAQINNKIEENKYISIGKGIGVAVNETLMAVENSAIRIAEPSLGKTAIFIVVWKLLCSDIIKLLLGICSFIIFVICLFKVKNAYYNMQECDYSLLVIYTMATIATFITSIGILCNI